MVCIVCFLWIAHIAKPLRLPDAKILACKDTQKNRFCEKTDFAPYDKKNLRFTTEAKTKAYEKKYYYYSNIIFS